MGSRGGIPTQQWWIGFIGSGNIDEANALASLDNFLPNDGTEINIFLPDNISRSNKGLKTVQSLLKGWDLDYDLVVAQDVVNSLLHRQGDPAYLIILAGDEDYEDELVELAQRAAEKGIPIKNLCKALDDVEITEEDEAEQAPRQHGKPRGDGATMDVQGAATLAPAFNAAIGNSNAEILLNAIRTIIREEVQTMGLSIGHNTFVTDLDEQDVKIKAYVDSDGKYELAPEGRTKAPRGKRSVELTKDEAKDLDLI